MADKSKLVIRNIGLILSGMLEQPILDGDCIVAVDGKISAIGYERDLDTEQADTVIDTKGITLSPGLIDSHVHPVIGDYTPRQQQINWIDSCLHGGVTTMISAGEVHMPGISLALKPWRLPASAGTKTFDLRGLKCWLGRR